MLGVELVLLLAPDPWQIATRCRDLVVSLRLLALELRELVPGHLPFLAGSDPVFGHLICLQSKSKATPTGSRNKTPDDLENHRKLADMDECPANPPRPRQG